MLTPSQRRGLAAIQRRSETPEERVLASAKLALEASEKALRSSLNDPVKLAQALKNVAQAAELLRDFAPRTGDDVPTFVVEHQTNDEEPECGVAVLPEPAKAWNQTH